MNLLYEIYECCTKQLKKMETNKVKEKDNRVNYIFGPCGLMVLILWSLK